MDAKQLALYGLIGAAAYYLLLRRKGPPPIAGGYAAPRDLDGDGRYEDVNGDGVVDVADGLALQANLASPTVQGYIKAYDFDCNGVVDNNDVITLLNLVIGFPLPVCAGARQVSSYPVLRKGMRL